MPSCCDVLRRLAVVGCAFTWWHQPGDSHAAPVPCRALGTGCPEAPISRGSPRDPDGGLTQGRGSLPNGMSGSLLVCRLVPLQCKWSARGRASLPRPGLCGCRGSIACVRSPPSSLRSASAPRRAHGWFTRLAGLRAGRRVPRPGCGCVAVCVVSRAAPTVSHRRGHRSLPPARRQDADSSRPHQRVTPPLKKKSGPLPF